MPVTYKPTNVVNSPFIRYSGTSAYSVSDMRSNVRTVFMLYIVYAMVKSANTLKSYQRKERRFLNWLSSEEPRCWDEGVPEVIIERITSEKICSLIPEESQRLDGSMKKFGTAVSINIALMYYYQRKKCKMQDDYLSQQERVF